MQNTENQNLARHANDLESRVALLEKELEALKKQHEEESQEALKRHEELASQADSLANSLSGKYFTVACSNDTLSMPLSHLTSVQRNRGRRPSSGDHLVSSAAPPGSSPPPRASALLARG